VEELPEAKPARASRQHPWPMQKGTASRTGYSPHVMPDISKGPTWFFEEPHGDISRSTPLIDDQMNIYVTSNAGRSYKLTVDGKLLWTHYTDSMGTVPGVPSLSDSVMILLTKRGWLIALDLETGAEAWKTRVAEQVSGSADCLLVTEDVIITAITDPVPLRQTIGQVPEFMVPNNRVVALALADGSLRWAFRPVQPTYNFQASTIQDGSIVFQDQAGGVYRLSTADGQVLWQVPPPDLNSHTTAAAVIHEGRVFAVSNLGSGESTARKEKTGVLHTYDYKDGRLLWFQELPFLGNQAVAVGEIAGSAGKKSLILGMGENPGLPVVVRIAAKVPDIVRPFVVLCFPLHLVELNFPWVFRLFIKEQHRSVVALDLETGAFRWYHKLEPFRLPAATGDAEGFVRRFKARESGANPNPDPWCLPDANAQPVIDGAGTAFVPFQDGKVYAIRDENGDGDIAAEEVKERLVGSAFQAAGAMAEGLLAFIDCGGRLEVFRA